MCWCTFVFQTSGASATSIQRADSMTLNRTPARQPGNNYKDNWENFDEVTATMRRNKAKNRYDISVIWAFQCSMERYRP